MARELPSTRDRYGLGLAVARLVWFHQIDFGDGIVSYGRAPAAALKAQADVYFRDSIKGKSVLDIGCWDGFNSFEAHKRGASRVLATDHFTWNDGWGDPRAFELARQHIAPEVEVQEIAADELSLEKVGPFDVVLFLGVFYHLRHPFAVLERIAPIATERLIVETHLDARSDPRPTMIFYPGSELGGDHTNWCGPNAACVTAMMIDLGFRSVEFVENPVANDRGIFIAKR
jgi:tRNA (mo5U34)-methyltransferase